MVPMSFKESEIDVFVPFVGNTAETLGSPKTSDQKDEIRGLHYSNKVDLENHYWFVNKY